MSVTLQQLEFFRAVARHLSFSQAAKELYTSQPYVSNQIRRLEDRYGVPLFIRSQPRITLTEAGQLLYEHVDRILEDVDELEHLVKQFQGLERGTIQIAATASAGNHVVPELIASFHQAYPEIVVEARVGNTEDVLTWLDLDECELGISPQKPSSGNLVAEDLYREQLVVIAPAAMQLPEPLPVHRLAKLPKVVRESGSLTWVKMSALLDAQDSGHDFVAQLTGTTAVNEAVAAGLGVSLVPERSAKAWLEAGSVRKVELERDTPYHQFYMVYAPRRYLSPAARAFTKHVRAAVRE